MKQWILRQLANIAFKNLLTYTKFPPDHMADRRDQFYKEATLISELEIYPHLIRTIVDEAKDNLALKAQNELETSFNRGIVYGLKMLDSHVNTLKAGPRPEPK